MKETNGETRNDCKIKFQAIFGQKLGLDGIKIEHAHQVKCNIRGINSSRPRKIVVKLLRLKGKTKVFQKTNKLKGQNIFINNDLSTATLELEKDLMVEVKRLREIDKIGYLNYSIIVSR